MMEAIAAAGGRMVGQSHSRGINVLLSFKTTLPFDKLPVWKEFREQTIPAQAVSLRDPLMRCKLVDAARNAVYGQAFGAEAPPPNWEKLYVYDKPLPPYRSLAELARERGLHPVEVMIDEALAGDMATFFFQSLTDTSDEDRVGMIRSPHTVMTFSDSGAHVGQIADASIQSYMIAYWYRDRGEFTLEEAVAKMSSGPARVWGFADRGILRAGYAADLNIFDPKTFGPLMPEVVHDFPTGVRRLSQRSSGMKATIIGGAVTIENGSHTGATAGRLIRAGQS